MEHCGLHQGQRLPLLVVVMVMIAGREVIMGAEAAGVIVAAHNSPPKAKARADYVCSGYNDQQYLGQSLVSGTYRTCIFDTSPDSLGSTMCYSGLSVEWLPGDYMLNQTLVIPQAEDAAIHAEGARFHYSLPTGNAIVISGASRCRYNLGAIFSRSSGSALSVSPGLNSSPIMPVIQSTIGFTGLICESSKRCGAGLEVQKPTVTSRFVGTDIRGFETGVFINDQAYTGGTIDTNWYWLSYVRMCTVAIYETGSGVNSQQWFVNVDASVPNSVAIQTAASDGQWQVIMGTYDWIKHPGDQTRSIILLPGAAFNRIKVTPPLWSGFAPFVDQSGNPTNEIVQIPKSQATVEVAMSMERASGYV